MLSPEVGRALADLGGFALFLLTVSIAGVGLYRQWWVPGWVYRQERQSRITAEIQAVRNGEALEKLARAVTRDERKPRRPPPVAEIASPHDPD